MRIDTQEGPMRYLDSLYKQRLNPREDTVLNASFHLSNTQTPNAPLPTDTPFTTPLPSSQEPSLNSAPIFSMLSTFFQTNCLPLPTSLMEYSDLLNLLSSIKKASHKQAQALFEALQEKISALPQELSLLLKQSYSEALENFVLPLILKEVSMEEAYEWLKTTLLTFGLSQEERKERFKIVYSGLLQQTIEKQVSNFSFDEGAARLIDLWTDPDHARILGEESRKKISGYVSTVLVEELTTQLNNLSSSKQFEQCFSIIQAAERLFEAGNGENELLDLFSQEMQRLTTRTHTLRNSYDLQRKIT